MKYVIACLFSLLFLNLTAQNSSENDSTKITQKKLFLSGYVKEMPSLEYNNIHKNILFNNILHNRINFRYRQNTHFQIGAGVRNRLISGYMVQEHSDFMIDFLKEKSGFVRSSFIPYSNNNHIVHSDFDRFFADWQKDKLQLRVGRQRINWGINMISNPNDLFNTYSFFDFDYEERPGADALRLQYFTGELSRYDFAFAPSENLKESTAALMYAFNQHSYDIQLLGGYYKNRIAVGGGWAGHIKTSGFKGEFSLFQDVDSFGTSSDMDFIAAVSIDHMFSNSMYVLFEALYNGGYEESASLFVMSKPMAADNIFISKYALTGSLMYPISPILNGTLTGIYMPDISSAYIMSNIGYSLASNLDMNLIVLYFRYSGLLSLQQISTYLQIKWSF